MQARLYYDGSRGWVLMKMKSLLLATRNLFGGVFAVAICGLILVLLAVTADYFLYPVMVRPRMDNFNSGQNGLWFGSKWYLGKVGDKDIEGAARLLKDEQIAYAYFHCRDIDKRGALRYPSPAPAQKLTAAMHKQCPNVKIIAWIGAVNARTGGEVDLALPAVRDRMASQAAWLVRSCGFDGVQWDYELCLDNDSGFMDLLKLTREQLPPASFLSVAAPTFGWSDKYATEVSGLCDQIALMDYDTGRYLPRLYVDTVKADVVRFAGCVAGSKTKCRLVVGVPTYEEATVPHHPHAENLLMAVVGVKDGLADPACRRDVVAGIAPYAEYTTDANEWAIYRKYWLMSP